MLEKVGVDGWGYVGSGKVCYGERSLCDWESGEGEGDRNLLLLVLEVGC